MTSKRVLITGGCGRIGSRVGAALAERGYTIRVLDVISGQTPGVEYCVADITDHSAVSESMRDVDYVIHLAAIPVENGQSVELFESNVRGAFTVIDAAAAAGVQGFAFASTIATYGLLHPSQPFAPQYLPVDEESPLVPDRNYANMKIVAENFLHSYSRSSGMDAVSLRIATVMTPDAGFWKPIVNNPEDAERAFIGEKTIRDFFWQYVHVDDVVQAFTLSVEHLKGNPGRGFQAFNIGAEDTISAVPSLDLIGRYFPDLPVLKDPARFSANPHASLFSIEKARRVLGYEPTRHWKEMSDDAL